ncbi:hypothetical protein [Ruegeria sp. MALMAid1280]|uniref:hypothetical protein n=1 Tax=Ruegeria sp. MALMAid1280 TaxID=3411634 RepID=UPI003B9F8E43
MHKIKQGYLKAKGKHAVTLIWGEDSCRRYRQGEKDKAVLNEHGKCRTYEFQTLSELNAFLWGVEEAFEWFDWEHYEED